MQEPGEITPGALGAEVELKCGEVTAVVQLIETTDATADQFWALPAEVERVRAQDELGAEALSKKHRLHPAVGYARIKPRDRPRDRPTWDGSAAQVYDEAKRAEASDAVESGSSSSDEDSEGDDEALVSNARRAGHASEHATKKRRRCVRAVESAVDTKEEVHTVLAVFGEGADGPEVWLGLKVQCRTRNKTRIQFLEVDEGDEGDEGDKDDEGGEGGEGDAVVKYELTSAHEVYTPEMIEHTFENVAFVVTTTFKLGKRGGRLKHGSTVNTRTKVPFVSSVMEERSQKIKAA